MALFKIFKGSSNNLGAVGSVTARATEGFAYFTTNTGKLYIDIATADKAVVGTNRIPLNAEMADKLSTKPEIAFAKDSENNNDIFMSIKVGGQTSTAVYIPRASGDQAGVVTAVDQTFAGTKTFLNSPVFNAGIKVNNGTIMNSNGSILMNQTETTSGVNTGALFLYSNNLYHNSTSNRIITHKSQFVKGTQTAQTNAFTGNLEDIDALYDGLTIDYWLPQASNANATLNLTLSNGAKTGAKPVYRYGTTRLGNDYPPNSIIRMIYRSNYIIGSNAVSGWWVLADKDSNSDVYQRLYVSTDNVEYPITARYNTTTGNSSYTEYGRYSEGITLNPSTNTITASAFKGNLTGNASTATAFSSARSIALTGNVTGSASANGSAGWSIATTIANNAVTSEKIKDGNVTNAKLAYSSVTIAGNEIALGGALTKDTLLTSLGLSSAMRFIGTATKVIADSSVIDPVIAGYDWTNGRRYGDVIIDSASNYEYVWSVASNATNGQWELLGGDNHKIIQTAKSSPSASGSAIAFIDTISQNANGEITATKKNVREASASQSGVVSTGTQTFAGAKTFSSSEVIVQTSSGGACFRATNGTKSVFVGVGSGGTNHGVYSDTLGEWLVYANDAGEVFLNGSALKLKTARTITLASGSFTFDGSANKTLTANDMGLFDLNNRGTALEAGTNVDTDITVGGNYYIPDSTAAQEMSGSLPFTSSGMRLIFIKGYQSTRNRQLAFGSANTIYHRTLEEGTWRSWLAILDSGNYTTYAPPKNHASTATTYGVGTVTDYGHVKVPGGNGLSISSGSISLALASATAAGAMSAADKTKLDALGSIITIEKTLTVGTQWMDTGIAGDNAGLDTGTYIVQLGNNGRDATGMYSELFSGVMSWRKESTNGDRADEILLHNGGYAILYNKCLYLRILRTKNGYMKLQISANTSIPSTTYTFKFRKII